RRGRRTGAGSAGAGLRPALSKGDCMNLVIGFDDPRADAIDTSGGKGASLARAARELPVPDGVIVSSDAYRRFMQPLAGAVSHTLAECGDDAGAAAQRVRELVQIGRASCRERG